MLDYFGQSSMAMMARHTPTSPLRLNIPITIPYIEPVLFNNHPGEETGVAEEAAVQEHMPHSVAASILADVLEHVSLNVGVEPDMPIAHTAPGQGHGDENEQGVENGEDGEDGNDSEDLDEDLDEDVDEDEDEDIDEDIDEDNDEDLDEDLDEDIDEDVDEDADEDVHEDIDEDFDEGFELEDEHVEGMLPVHVQPVVHTGNAMGRTYYLCLRRRDLCEEEETVPEETVPEEDLLKKKEEMRRF